MEPTCALSLLHIWGEPLDPLCRHPSFSQTLSLLGPGNLGTAPVVLPRYCACKCTHTLTNAHTCAPTITPSPHAPLTHTPYHVYSTLLHTQCYHTCSHYHTHYHTHPHTLTYTQPQIPTHRSEHCRTARPCPGLCAP